VTFLRLCPDALREPGQAFGRKGPFPQCHTFFDPSPNENLLFSSFPYITLLSCVESSPIHTDSSLWRKHGRHVSPFLTPDTPSISPLLLFPDLFPSPTLSITSKGKFSRNLVFSLLGSVKVREPALCPDAVVLIEEERFLPLPPPSPVCLPF